MTLCGDLQNIKDIAFKQGVGNIVFEGIQRFLKKYPDQKLDKDEDKHTLLMME